MAIKLIIGKQKKSNSCRPRHADRLVLSNKLIIMPDFFSTISGGLRKLPPLFVFSSVVSFLVKRRSRSRNIQGLLISSPRRLNLSRLTFLEEGLKMVSLLEKKMEEVKLEEKLREDEDFIGESETEDVPVLDGEASIKNKKKKKKKKGKSKVW